MAAIRTTATTVNRYDLNSDHNQSGQAFRGLQPRYAPDRHRPGVAGVITEERVTVNFAHPNTNQHVEHYRAQVLQAVGLLD
jgi:hypothetical protein